MRTHSAPGIVAVTGTAEEVLGAMFGAPQHDAHARLWHRLEHRRQLRAEQPVRDAAIKTFVAECIEDEREAQAQRAAEQHGYNVTAIRFAYDRWHTGCFSREPFAPTRARQLLRALDIAIAHHGALQAAE